MTQMRITDTTNMPSVMSLATGRLGHGVVADRKKTKYIRLKYRDTKPLTAKQIAQHEKYRLAEDAYNSMSVDERKVWYSSQSKKSYSAYHRWMQIHLKKGGPYG